MSDQDELVEQQRNFEKTVLNRFGLRWRFHVVEGEKKSRFPQALFWWGFVTLIVLYTVAGTYSPRMLSGMDTILTPVVHALAFVGLGIKKPFMDGVMPKEVYVNLTGIAIWGALVYNVASVLFFDLFKWTVPSNAEVKQRMLKKNLSWSPTRIWLTLAIGLPIVATCFTFCLLNGINGWIVFHMHGVFITAFWPVFFLLVPGSAIFLSWFLLTKLAAAALAGLVRS